MALTDPVAALCDVWRQRMPITAALHVSVVTVSDSELRLGMPLAPNRNHKGTMFAGSLSALATLAGWSTLWLLMQEADPESHLVIQDATIRYLRPVRTDATARAVMPERAIRDKLLATYQRRGRARIPVEATIHDTGNELVASFRGRYVVHR